MSLDVIGGEFWAVLRHQASMGLAQLFTRGIPDGPWHGSGKRGKGTEL